MTYRLLDPDKTITVVVGAELEPNPIVKSLDDNGEALLKSARIHKLNNEELTTEEKVLIAKITKAQKELKEVKPGIKIDIVCLDAQRQLILSKLAFDAQDDPTSINLDQLFEIMAESVKKIHIDGAPEEITAKTFKYMRPIETTMELAMKIANVSGLNEEEEKN